MMVKKFLRAASGYVVFLTSIEDGVSTQEKLEWRHQVKFFNCLV